MDRRVRISIEEDEADNKLRIGYSGKQPVCHDCWRWDFAWVRAKRIRFILHVRTLCRIAE